MTRYKLTRLNTNTVVDGSKRNADENTFSSNLKQSFEATLKLFASQNCKPDL